ncbi:NAD(+) diphosphatase [Allorhizocola rhizosphaerae]|uniref:NAD(+) diphosphatase n=1 Tax=Allorhizocola rhizosphaerae TaxID=1872709 RepID=UPI001FEB379E|nr:NAD(+) diphosphatase [Allorhizocola rhizosphaerae]
MTDTGVWPPLDRAAHRRSDPQWLAEAWERAFVVVIAPDGRSLIGPAGLVLFKAAGIEGERLFLGVDDTGTPYFAVAVEPPPVDDAALKHLWEVGADLNPRHARLFAQALGLIQWHNDYRFSPMTGEPTVMEQAGWVRREANGELHFPRTDPAVIMLVHDGVAGPQGRALLGSGVLWVPTQGIRRYSTLAGFVEPGETAEAAVAREVLEEAGVHVTQMKYFGSQPHPYPRSLMLGFFALANPDEPVSIDPGELADARWFTRAEIAAVAERTSDAFRLPNRSSIAYRLITRWLAGES